MNTKTRSVLIFSLALLAGMALWVTLIQAAPGNAPTTPGGSPTVVSYQGQVTADGSPYGGTGYFKFAVVNAEGATTYWSNDGSSESGGEPENGVSLQVDNGLFHVLLGDPSLEYMEAPLEADVFEDIECYLRVWFSGNGESFVQLSPDRRIAAVPYALQAQEALSAANADTVDGEHASAFANASHNHAPANISPQGAGSGLDADTVDGLHAADLETHYQNVVVVAKSGGDFTSVQAAIDSITGETADNAYLVWVAPGLYEEQVTMKPYVHLQGAGQEVTIIYSVVDSSAWPPDQATLVLASDTSLRDLTLGNGGTGEFNVALLATAGIERTLAADVTARAQGGGIDNFAVFLTGGSEVILQQITALGEHASGENLGLFNQDFGVATLRGGSFTGRGGAYAFGIRNEDSGTTLEAENVTALGENGGNTNRGLYNFNGAAATLRGGTFAGRGGTNAYGIYNEGASTTLEAESVTALGENGGNINFGLRNINGAAVTLRGGSFTGRGGGYAYGISNRESGTKLEAESVTALGEGGSDFSSGLRNTSGAVATLRGGSCTGRGGGIAYGITNSINNATLEAESVIALGEDGSSHNYGLFNTSGAVATLSGGSFTGRGWSTWGIYNDGNGTALEAESVIALGEGASTYNYGLQNTAGATATLRNGSFTGRGGTYAIGINTTGSNSVLEAESVTALGENGSDSSSGLRNISDAVATLRGGSCIGQGGTNAYGIENFSGSATVEAENITALGQNGNNTNFGLASGGSGSPTANVTQSVLEGATNSVSRSAGTVEISNSRLVGGAASGTVSCVAVSRNSTFNANGCP